MLTIKSLRRQLNDAWETEQLVNSLVFDPAPEAAPEATGLGQTLIIRNNAIMSDLDYEFLALPITPTLLETLNHYQEAAHQLTQLPSTPPEGAYYLHALTGLGFYFDKAFGNTHGIPTERLLAKKWFRESDPYRWYIHPQNLADHFQAPGSSWYSRISLFVDWTGGTQPYFQVISLHDDGYGQNVSDRVYFKEFIAEMEAGQ
jgi:hypothetical protein